MHGLYYTIEMNFFKFSNFSIITYEISCITVEKKKTKNKSSDKACASASEGRTSSRYTAARCECAVVVVVGVQTNAFPPACLFRGRAKTEISLNRNTELTTTKGRGDTSSASSVNMKRTRALCVHAYRGNIVTLVVCARSTATSH